MEPVGMQPLHHCIKWILALTLLFTTSSSIMEAAMICRGEA